MENSSPRVSQEAGRQARKRAKMLTRDRTAECWRSLHVGAERGYCEHMQALVAKELQRHWEWQEDRRTDFERGFYRYNTAVMASLDVKTAFDVVKPSVVSRILSWSHGHVTAALLAEMQDVQGS